jgi:uncharacterized RDD family membrane protein YckC
MGELVLCERCAGAARRAVATLIDMLVFSGLSAAIVLPLASGIDWAARFSSLEDMTTALTNPAWLGHASGMLGIWIALWWSYFVVGWGLIGATPGKWLLGLRVVDYRGRHPIGAARAALRLVAYSVTSVTLGWGHLLIVFRRDHRGLHDILAGTRVVRATRVQGLGPRAQGSEPPVRPEIRGPGSGSRGPGSDAPME